MEVATDTGHQITARKLMEIILYDNGLVNRYEPDNISRYPKKYFDWITKACEVFFEAHPEFLTEEHLESIAAGEFEENQEIYGIYPEYAELDNALNNFHDH